MSRQREIMLRHLRDRLIASDEEVYVGGRRGVSCRVSVQSHERSASATLTHERILQAQVCPCGIVTYTPGETGDVLPCPCGVRAPIEDRSTFYRRSANTYSRAHAVELALQWVQELLP